MAVRVKSKSPATNGRPRTAVNGEEDDAAWRRKTGRKHGKLMGIRHILQNYRTEFSNREGLVVIKMPYTKVIVI